MSESPDTVSYQGTPSTTDEKYELAQLIAGLVAGDEVVMKCSDATRTASVERDVEEYNDTPDWTGLCLSEGDVGYVLSGHGTEYLLTVNADDDEPMLPRLEYPSVSTCALVTRVEVRDRGEQIQSDTRADDIFWRVDRYGGR